MVAKLCLLFCLLPCFAYGQYSPQLADAINHTVHVMSQNGRYTDHGSGVYLGSNGQQGFVITNHHVVRDGLMSGNRVAKVRYRDGKTMIGSVIRHSEPADIAIIQLEQAHEWLGTIYVADSAPQRGQKVWLAGFDLGKDKLRVYDGQAISATMVNTPSINGDSGGPVFYEDGRYIAPLWGTDDRSTSICHNSDLRELIAPIYSHAYPAGYQNCDPYGQQQGFAPHLKSVPPPQFAPIGPPQSQPPQSQQPQFPPLVGPKNSPSGEMCVPLVFEYQKAVDLLIADKNFIAAVAAKAPKGDPGKDGEPGKPGRDGAPGADGRDAGFSAEQIAQIVAMAAEQAKDQIVIPPSRVVLVDGKTKKILDDETYQPGEPIVIDFQRIRDAATK